MRTLLTLMALLLTIQTTNANPFEAFVVGAKSTSQSLYSTEQVKSLLSSNKVACFYFNRKAYISKGYKAKYGVTKEFCSTKRAKSSGVLRLNKNNLTEKALIALSK